MSDHPHPCHGGRAFPSVTLPEEPLPPPDALAPENRKPRGDGVVFDTGPSGVPGEHNYIQPEDLHEGIIADDLGDMAQAPEKAGCDEH